MNILLEGFKVEDMPRGSPAPGPLRGYLRSTLGCLACSPVSVVFDEDPGDVPR